MTDSELNRRLAKALGWKIAGPDFIWGGKAPDGTWHMGFSPATDSNDLREYVLPEVARRGLFGRWCQILLNEHSTEIRPRLKAMAKREAVWAKEITDDKQDQIETLAVIYAAFATACSSPRALASAALQTLEDAK